MASFKLAAAAAAILLFAASASLSLADQPATSPATYSGIGAFPGSPVPLGEIVPLADGPVENPKNEHLSPEEAEASAGMLECFTILGEGGAGDECLRTVLDGLTLNGPFPTGQCCENVLKLDKNSQCWAFLVDDQDGHHAVMQRLLNHCRAVGRLLPLPRSP